LPYKNHELYLASHRVWYQKNRERLKAYREENHEKIKAYKKAYLETEHGKMKMKTYREANHEKISAQSKAYYQKNREELLPKNKIYKILKNEEKYGVSYPTWWLCDGCCKPISFFKGEIILDHNHKTGKFRSWLCYSCNIGLGFLDGRQNWQIERMLELVI
jgi:hypothetical protein